MGILVIFLIGIGAFMIFALVAATNDKQRLTKGPPTNSKKSITYQKVERPRPVDLVPSFSDTVKQSVKEDKSNYTNSGYSRFKILIERRSYQEYYSFDYRLSLVRKGRYLSQSAAADLLGISVSTLSSYENGHTTPSNYTLERMAFFYDVSPQFLKYGYDDNFKNHLKWCEETNQEHYIEDLRYMVYEVSTQYPELLSDEERTICKYVYDHYNMKFDLFNEKANILNARLAEIRQEILELLSIESSVLQKELYKSYGDERELAMRTVRELFDTGTIEKAKAGNSYMLTLASKNNKEVLPVHSKMSSPDNDTEELKNGIGKHFNHPTKATTRSVPKNPCFYNISSSIFHKNKECMSFSIIEEWDAITKSEALQKGMSSCEKCANPIAFVYPSGQVYHKTKFCSDSASIPNQITETDAISKGLRRCSKCY